MYVLGFCSVCAFFSFFMRVILSFFMLECVNYALLYAYFGGVCAALCVFWWNMHDFMRLCRVLVVAVSGGIVRGTLFAAWCSVFDVIVTHFFFYQLHIGIE